MDLVAKALHFAAVKHQHQSRKQGGNIPFINHPIEVLHLLTQAGIQNHNILAASLLHDILDDTLTSVAQIEQEFGEQVTILVKQCSDGTGISDAEGKKKQVQKATNISDGAKLIKLADKISNNRYVLLNPPQKWSPERRQGYFIWSELVCDRLKGLNHFLDRQIDHIFAQSKIYELSQGDKDKLLYIFYESLQHK